jgi:sulfur carrier protein ThiS
MKVYIEKDSKSLNLRIKKSEKIDGKKLLKKLKINYSSVILVKNDEVVLEDEIFENSDEVKILSVVSGG